MAVTRKTEPTFEPPPARLFLDDVEEIIRILREAANYQEWEPLPEEGEPKLSLSFKDVVCDGVEDLPKVGKKTTELTIKLRRSLGCSLQVSIWPTHSDLLVTGVKEEGEWLLYGKLQAIYLKRRVRWKEWLRRIPWWVLVVLFMFVSLWAQLSSPARTQPTQPLTLLGILFVTVVAVVVVALIGLVAYKVGLQHTVVIFRYSHEGGDITKTSKNLLPYIISAAIGGAVYALAERLIRKMWP